jgi:hypothetical protein
MKKIQGKWIADRSITTVTSMRGALWGLIAGLVGTMAMDLTLLVGLSALGLPPDTCYLTIGSTVRHFFSLLGIKLAGDLTLGVSAYHLIGPLLGLLYGLIVSQVSALQRTTLKKTLIYAALYAEALSQLILTLTPVLLRMPAQEALMWFAGSFVLHAIWGAVTGLVTYYGLRIGRLAYRNVQTGKKGEISWIATK